MCCIWCEPSFLCVGELSVTVVGIVCPHYVWCAAAVVGLFVNKWACVIFFVSLGGLCIFWWVVDPSRRGVVCLHMVHVSIMYRNDHMMCLATRCCRCWEGTARSFIVPWIGCRLAPATFLRDSSLYNAGANAYLIWLWFHDAPTPLKTFLIFWIETFFCMTTSSANRFAVSYTILHAFVDIRTNMLTNKLSYT